MTIYAIIRMTLGDLLLKVCRCGRTRILTDSVGKRNRKEVLANNDKTRINIGHQHNRWMELKETLSSNIRYSSMSSNTLLQEKNIILKNRTEHKHTHLME